ncbi:MAG: cytochrome c oxidase subunit 3 family protein [Bacteriovoracaceae bacterium]|nr:cytochrome c oxidase subunit 3 family protein [Bacteriovoracaceae bacterium]
MSTGKVDRRVEPSHHFDSMIQEHDAGKQGVWLFMATELMMFGALFAGYFIYRTKYFDAWVEGGSLLDWRLGAFNTIVLLLSSFTMAQAVTDSMQGHNKKAFRNVIITTACAFIFMIVKYFEYSGKIHHGLFPGLGMWNPEAVEVAQTKLFMTFYFVMTGLHGIHILVGIGLMVWLMKRLKNDEFSKEYYTSVEGVGLYWHIVDIIWIFLFPLMYLI